MISITCGENVNTFTNLTHDRNDAESYHLFQVFFESIRWFH